ncbi:protein kinase domain-containing protein [Colletotrichum truncatum]|uniref:Protein kinase domain-containing protein n=1 Tax=Colletotrichum truncatum TaxID=5467 RepID=A0ACC3ZJF9_COLTU|nr:protein kinase domain-containing protein [Colletotrichum truncatum]KAF6799647.1 protein kinase domain-containing protein [Colletotrichum truncatum]
MAQTSVSSMEPPPSSANQPANTSFLRKLFGRNNGSPALGAVGPSHANEPEPEPEPDSDDPQHAELGRRVSRQVVPGLPRVQTFKRQQSERRNNLAPVEPSPAERRALSVDRRVQPSRTASQSQTFPRASAPDFFQNASFEVQSAPSVPASPIEGRTDGSLSQMVAQVAEPAVEEYQGPDIQSNSDAHSVTTSQSQYDAMIHEELETTWILNLSMHFRDKSKREKFFVTYRETPTLWRRVTISLDYRNAPDGSLEKDLLHNKSQRDKSSKIYEAIRDSLQDIQFYPSVTNLKLQTTDGRLHVHVVEDVNEIIQYPTVRQVQHLGCRRIKERDIEFDSHMSGFVYKVCVGGEVLIKKEIPGPDTIDEFLYEINALNRLRYSRNIIQFYGVVVDDDDEHVKGLLISYAVHGALIDVIYDNRQESELGLPWPIREKWARQIVQGLADIHEAGFVQGDFTLSNIVIDYDDDAKIIDINRRGCPMGWEPPEATPLIESNQRISMYIGVKSDLYQLGMVLWALATQDDEPEAQGRPLQLGEECIVPAWYREVVDICLSEDPRSRPQASSILTLFPETDDVHDIPPSISVDDGYSMQEYFVDGYQGNGQARVRTVQPSQDWSYVNMGHTYVNPNMGYSQDPYYYTRGRSPPSPLPSHYGRCDSPNMGRNISAWAGAKNIAPSYSDIGVDEIEEPKSATPTTSKDSIATPEPLEEASKAMQRKLEDLHMSNDLSPLDEADMDHTPMQENTRLVGEELARVLTRDQHAEPCSSVDPVDTRPTMASPMTIKNVTIDEGTAGVNGGTKASVGREMLAEEKETAGQSAPVAKGDTEPRDQTDRKNTISSEGADAVIGALDTEHKDTAAESLVLPPTRDTPPTAEAKPEPTAETVAGSVKSPTTTAPGSTVWPAESLVEIQLPNTEEEAKQRVSQPAFQLVPDESTGTHKVEALELKGVGAAYLETNERMMREKMSFDDDLAVAKTAPTISTDAQK